MQRRVFLKGLLGVGVVVACTSKPPGADAATAVKPHEDRAARIPTDTSAPEPDASAIPRPSRS